MRGSRNLRASGLPICGWKRRGIAAHRLTALRRAGARCGIAQSRATGCRDLRKSLAMAAVMSALGTGAYAFHLGGRTEQIYATAIGGHKTITLGDGSQVELNTDTVLRVAADQRRTRHVARQRRGLFSGQARLRPSVRRDGGRSSRYGSGNEIPRAQRCGSIWKCRWSKAACASMRRTGRCASRCCCRPATSVIATENAIVGDAKSPRESGEGAGLAARRARSSTTRRLPTLPPNSIATTARRS